MTKNLKSFSETIQCPHCGNRAPMERVAKCSQVEKHQDEVAEMQFEYGDVYELLLCPACYALTLRKYFWHELHDPEDVTFEILYPMSTKVPTGLPDTIKTAYEAALRVRMIDPNAYAMLVGRVLEMVCVERRAKGKQLGEMLADLSAKGEIPGKLVGVAKGLRNLRNVGAHATLGGLTKAEVPILEDLCKAILEYVYSAPFLAQQAEDRLAHVRKSKE